MSKARQPMTLSEYLDATLMFYAEQPDSYELRIPLHTLRTLAKRVSEPEMPLPHPDELLTLEKFR